MTLKERTKAAESAGLVGRLDGRTVANIYRKFVNNPGELDDPDLLQGLAIAEAWLGHGGKPGSWEWYSGWIPQVQKLACEIYDIPE